MRHLLTLCVTLLLSACAGYRFQEKNNPFAQYGISSISVPMFYNHSNFSNISAPMTKEVFQMLASFSKLKVYSGDKKADATLIGIIDSPDRMIESHSVESLRSAKSAMGAVIGDAREDFYIPASTRLNMSLRIILIKNPSEKEIELLRASLGRFAVGPRIIVNETINLSGTFTRELYGADGVDVIGTQNRSAATNTAEDMAERAAQNFKDMILYAF